MADAAGAPAPAAAAADDDGAAVFERYRAVAFPPAGGAARAGGLGQHRCQLFQPQSFLFEERWLGCTSARVELLTTKRDEAEAHLAAVREQMRRVGLDADVGHVEGSLGGVSVVVRGYSGPLEAEAMKRLISGVLWVEPHLHDVWPQERVERHTAHLDRIMDAERKQMERDCHDLLLAASRGPDADKAGEATSQIIVARKQLEALASSRRRVRSAVTCTMCDRLLAIYGPPDSELRAERDALLAHAAELERKLAEAAGGDNKQRRKKLQRKLKETRAQIDVLASQGAGAAGGGGGGGSDADEK